jgi:CheY-like chemotaxis protein
VIDDDPGVRRYVLEALTNLGYEAREAPDGPSGLEAFHAAPTDLLVLDYAMPGMTGADVARQVRAERPDMPILFVSGYAESEALEASVGTRARLLRKPFETAALARCVDEALSA